MDFFHEKYGADVIIPRDKNTLLELQSKFGYTSKDIKDRYYIHYEEVRLVIMKPHHEKPATKI